MPHQANTKETATPGHLSEKPHTLQMAVILRSKIKAWIEAVGEGNKSQGNAIRYQLKLLAELTVIEALADRQFLPSYGFPIGLQKLRVIAPDDSDPTKIREEDQFRLERSGVLAVAEYVPGSQLLAGGKLITSHGVLKHWTGASLDSSPGLRGQFCQCENDHSYYLDRR